MTIRVTDIKIGDQIKFRAVTRWSNKAVWRKVTGFGPNGAPAVRYGGYSEFYVRPAEITAHETQTD